MSDETHDEPAAWATWAALADGCGHPEHGEAIHRAIEADLAGEILRGLAWLMLGWAEYLAHSDPGPVGHGRAAMAFDCALTALADRLQPRLPQRPTAPAAGPEGATPHLSVVPGRPAPMTKRGDPHGAPA